MWKTTRIEGQTALVMDFRPATPAGDRKQKIQQRLHDVRGAIRTVSLARELGAFDHLGRERAEALGKAVQILVDEAQFLVEAYATDC